MTSQPLPPPMTILSKCNRTMPPTPRRTRIERDAVRNVAREAEEQGYAIKGHQVKFAQQGVAIAVLISFAFTLTGLHEMDLERDVINQEGDTFEFYATHLVAAVATQIFSYMHDSGVAYGCIRTGEAFVFLHIPADPTVLEYFLCVPNKDVLEDDEHRLHRTAIGQMLAFTLQALAAEPPSQEWKETADKELATWEVEYLDVLRGIPETIRKEPPPSNYRPSHWKPVLKKHNTRSRARCKQDASTPHGSPNEDSSSDGDIPSPTPAPIVGSRSRRGNKDSSAGGRAHSTTNKSQAYSRTERPSYPYCTVACIRGLINKDILDEKCPNFEQHRGPKHPINALEFKRMLHQQLVQDREEGFEPLDIRGRTGYIIKATLLSHGSSSTTQL
ncbi:predicted protein [Histoplasma mississippiense (nom. inval.)]|uniref:predicted protein n=1 Tax=Ajellomyces capsulatus (strain NAm1 / WU24) TaxID=2059318 RepID=UPI000157C9BE|nr:predicted protein [Histoplasma mississippiense (nom. inval.)]EDN09040.1 predicted protein [Histoplasma mississippiense (nom. inval.)]